jgi:hypothetical protein
MKIAELITAMGDVEAKFQLTAPAHFHVLDLSAFVRRSIP